MKASHASSRGGRSVTMAVKRKRAATKPSSLSLPHERDESAENAGSAPETPGLPRPRIRQAQLDVERGLVDTERRGIPSDVPSPEGADAIRPGDGHRRKDSGGGAPGDG